MKYMNMYVLFSCTSIIVMIYHLCLKISSFKIRQSTPTVRDNPIISICQNVRVISLKVAPDIMALLCGILYLRV